MAKTSLPSYRELVASGKLEADPQQVAAAKALRQVARDLKAGSPGGLEPGRAARAEAAGAAARALHPRARRQRQDHADGHVLHRGSRSRRASATISTSSWRWRRTGSMPPARRAKGDPVLEVGRELRRRSAAAVLRRDAPDQYRRCDDRRPAVPGDAGRGRGGGGDVERGAERALCRRAQPAERAAVHRSDRAADEGDPAGGGQGFPAGQARGTAALFHAVRRGRPKSRCGRCSSG